MTTKLALYNQALLEIGERRLTGLTEARPPRYALDEVYDPALAFALEQGLWNFGIRSQELTYSASVTPAFGYTYAFEKPSDLVRLSMLTSDESQTSGVEDFSDEAGYWFANIDTMYTSYVSDNASYGMDLARWPATFERYVVLLLASRICDPETASGTKLERIEQKMKRALLDARSKDAMAGSNRYNDKSRWLRARNSGSRLGGTGRGL